MIAYTKRFTAWICCLLETILTACVLANQPNKSRMFNVYSQSKHNSQWPQNVVKSWTLEKKRDM